MFQGRLLCVTSNFPRWSGDSTTPFVLNLAQDLQSLGWEVNVLAPHAPQAARDEIIQGVRVERFRYLRPVRQQTVCYQGGALINLRKHPVNWLKLPALVAAESVAIARKLRTGRYDLMHSHWILPQGFAGMLARRGQHVPHVLTVHGGDIFGLGGRFIAPFKRAALRDADAVTVNSSVTETAVKAVGGSVPRLVRIPMGVSVEPLDSRQAVLVERLRQEHHSAEGPLLVFVGRIVEEKGIEDVLRAIQLLADSTPGMRVLIVGEGQDRADMERLATKLGIADITHFTGWVDSADIPSYLRAADVFVGPSRTASNGWIEAQGLTVIEAMVAGTPVVATRVGGVVDAVRHEHTGLLVDERAPGQIVGAVTRLWRDERLRMRLASNAYALAVERFSREVSAQGFSDLFEELVRDRPQQRR
ncbi:MAG: glycosyltransferase family 4 protein [Thiohalocapsa sp.]